METPPKATAPRGRPPTPPPPITDPLAAAASRIAVAQICRSAGYHAAEGPALRALADVSSRYLLALGRAAGSAANAAGRTDANLLDVVLALEELSLPHGFPGAAKPGGRLLGSSSWILRGLIGFVASVDEIPFARPLRQRRTPGAPPEPEPRPSFALLRRDPPFPHVPRWLPAFPDTWVESTGKKSVKKDLEPPPPPPPQDGNGTAAEEREKRMMPTERPRVRFRLGTAVAKQPTNAGVEQKKRKVEKIEQALCKEDTRFKPIPFDENYTLMHCQTNGFRFS